MHGAVRVSLTQHCLCEVASRADCFFSNIVAIQWFQTTLFWLQLFSLSNILLGLVSTPVAVNCVPYIAADTLCFVLDSYGCLCCLLLLKFVVRYTAMCGVVMLNYGVRLESSCLVGCICCVLPLHL